MKDPGLEPSRQGTQIPEEICEITYAQCLKKEMQLLNTLLLKYNEVASAVIPTDISLLVQIGNFPFSKGCGAMLLSKPNREKRKYSW